MKIVSFKICPFVQRVTALLEAKGIDYDIEYIDLSHKPQWFLDLSPNAQVPILITDDDDVLFESDAIVEFLDEVVGTPLSSDNAVKKAQDRAWSYLATKHYLVQCSAQRSPDAKTLEERSKKLSKAFGKIKVQLGESRYINGDDLSMVDIAWLPLLHRAAIIEQYSGYDFLEEFPKVKQWQQHLLSTGIAEKSVPEDFEERFTAFYLAESTCLGQLAKSKNGEACCGTAECTVDDLGCCA
ncbi:glutathione S-transferase family protein [Acaryochloris marina]|uniref:glutathione transferase n=1 Tax=Acaryochloris marina (strain MBIC 11017) TaxID=329726 RepID=A8ZK10_ACAM1|nr:glutathione S-transferase family protein [Acaryochloris marina]ABW31510.1 glutathione S-transferase, putative [Acaryochloris marina MBIC11017]